MRFVPVRLLVLGALLSPVGACSGSSPSACSNAVDGLSVSIEAAKNARLISPDVVSNAFNACGDSSTWEKAADADHIGTSLGFKPDMQDPLLTTSEALSYLCSHYGRDSITGTCRRA